MCCIWFAHDRTLDTWACVLETVCSAASNCIKSWMASVSVTIIHFHYFFFLSAPFHLVSFTCMFSILAGERYLEAWEIFWTWTDQSIKTLTAWRKEEWREKVADILWGREWSVFNQTNIGAVWGQSMGTAERWDGACMVFLECCNAILSGNWKLGTFSETIFLFFKSLAWNVRKLKLKSHSVHLLTHSHYFLCWEELKWKKRKKKKKERERERKRAGIIRPE